MPSVVQTSIDHATPAGRALAISGHSALSAMAKIASQAVSGDKMALLRMAQIFTQLSQVSQTGGAARPRRCDCDMLRPTMIIQRIQRSGSREFIRRAIHGEARLWQVWWLAGIPVIAAATWLGITAEDFRFDEEHAWGAILDTLKFMLCLFWLVSAWRCSHNVGSGFWRGMGRLAIALSVLFVGLTY